MEKIIHCLPNLLLQCFITENGVIAMHVLEKTHKHDYAKCKIIANIHLCIISIH